MAQTIEDLVVKIGADTGQLRTEMLLAAKISENALTDIQKAIADMSKSGSKDLSAFEQATATMAGFIGGSFVMGAFDKLKEGIGFFTDELKNSISEVNAEEKALTMLANSMALTGNYTEAAMTDLTAFTEELETLTGITPKQSAANLSLLSSMTRLSSEGLKQAEMAAVDLAAAYNMDLDSAVRLVGKGITGNVEAFKKFGITVAEGGSKAQNLSNIIQALSSTSGAAAGAMKTFEGSALLLNKAFGDMFDELAKSITQNAVVKAMMKELATTFMDVTSAAQGQEMALKNGLGEALVTTVNGLGNVVVIADAVVRALTLIVRSVTTADEFLQSAFDWAFTGFSDKAEHAFAKSGEEWEALTNTFSEDTSLSKLATSFYQIGEAGDKAMADITTSSKAIVPTIAGATKGVEELTAAQTAYNEQLASFATGLADQGSALAFSYENQLAMLETQHENELISKEEFLNASLELTLANAQAEDEALAAAREKGLIDETRYQDAKNGLLAKQNKDAANLAKKFTELEKNEQKQRLANYSDTLGQIASLSSSNNKALAAIGKAAAMSQATIDGILAVQKVLATVPYPASIPLAGLVGVAAAANVAKIAGVGLATGIDSVPGVGSRDNFAAVLAPGERVVPKKTNQDLKKFLEGQNDQPRNITFNLNIQNNLPASREAGAVMIEYINEALANGSLKILGT